MGKELCKSRPAERALRAAGDAPRPQRAGTAAADNAVLSATVTIHQDPAKTAILVWQHLFALV